MRVEVRDTAGVKIKAEVRVRVGFKVRDQVKLRSTPQFHTRNPSVPPPSVPHRKRVTVKLAYLELFWC